MSLSPTPSPTVIHHPKPDFKPLFSLPVIVSALGFFVDVYDMLIFSIVRIPSLQSLGLSKEEVSSAGTFILNWQQAGLVLGGILWGIIGDKRGRLAVLFGSIITYSIANILCGFVPSVTFMPVVDYYALMRFIAGVGLSGEIGAAIVLVSEILPKEIRGYGTAIVAGIGYLGAGTAYLTESLFDWQTAFFVGGGMGILLLILRIRVFESGLFASMKSQKDVSRGNFMQLFSSWSRAQKYLRCVAVGVPTWFLVGILATFANEFGEAMGIADVVRPGECVTMIYLGMAFGDFFAGPFSQWLRSRKKAVFFMLTGNMLFAGVFLFAGLETAQSVYIVCLLAGLCTGYVGMYLTMVAEQYGTNLRATATTSVPSIMRGTVIPMTIIYQTLKPSTGAIMAAGLLGVVVYGLMYWSLSRMEETFARDLAFVEE